MRGIRVALVLVTIALMAAGSAASGELRTGNARSVLSDRVPNLGGFPAAGDQRYADTNRGVDADRMQLSIERLDAAGQVIGSSSTWVLGGVPAGSRAYFSAPVAPAASYRLQVLSFDWVLRGAGG